MEEPNLAGMDSADLWRVSSYTDRRAGTIMVLEPVDVHGARDASRRCVYQSAVGMKFGEQVRNVEFTIEAVTLREAVEGWKVAAEGALKGEMERAEKESFAAKIALPGGMAARVN